MSPSSDFVRVIDLSHHTDRTLTEIKVLKREIVKAQAMLVEILKRFDKQDASMAHVENRIVMISRQQDLSRVTFAPVGNDALGSAGSTTDGDSMREGDSTQADVTGVVPAAEQTADKSTADQAAPAADQLADKSDAAPVAEQTQAEATG
jgi:hypothetical protein